MDDFALDEKQLAELKKVSILDDLPTMPLQPQPTKALSGQIFFQRFVLPIG